MSADAAPASAAAPIASTASGSGNMGRERSSSSSSSTASGHVASNAGVNPSGGLLTTPYSTLASQANPSASNPYAPERERRKLFIGSLASPQSLTEVRILARALLGVGSTGVIRFVEDLEAEEASMRAEAEGNKAKDKGPETGAAVLPDSAASSSAGLGADAGSAHAAPGTTALQGRRALLKNALRRDKEEAEDAEGESGSTTEEESEVAAAARRRRAAAAAALGADGRSAREREATPTASSFTLGAEDVPSSSAAQGDSAALQQDPQEDRLQDIPQSSSRSQRSSRRGLRASTAAGAGAGAGLSEAALWESAAVKRILDRHGWKQGEYELVRLAKGDFLCPGFVDTHTHACQIPNIGLGQQYELLDWLENVTFPRERRFSDLDYAARTYSSVVQRMIDSGTTTACYYATLHLEASQILARTCHERGQRAFVGKCQMDRNAPADYRETDAAQSVADTKSFIAYCKQLATVGGGGETINGAAKVLAAAASLNGNGTAYSEESGREAQGEGRYQQQKTNAGIEQAGVDSRRSSQSSSQRARITTSSSGGSIASAPQASSFRPRSPAALKRGSMSTGSGSSTPQTAAAAAAATKALNAALVQPILTPRFAIACTDALLSGISALHAREPTLRIQTHLSENPSEIEFTKSLFPFAESYTAVYDHFSLLTPRTVLAHCVHLEDDEVELLAKRGCGVSHCPTSNVNLRSGNCPVGKLLNRGIKVGLGTDVSGGYGLSIMSAIREASVVAKVLGFTQRDLAKKTDVASKEKQTAQDGAYDFTQGPLPIATLFYLATMGGAAVCAMEHKIGSLEPGKDFDALLVRSCPTWDEQRGYRGNPGFYADPDDTTRELLEKFMFTGDDRAISRVYVRGRRIDSGAAYDAR